MRAVFKGALVFLTLCGAAFADVGEIGVPPFPRDVQYLDSAHPIGALVRSAALEPLIKLKEGGTVVPVLAQSMSSSGVLRSLSFQLRKDAKFSNGAPVTSADVAFSLERCKEKGRLQGVREIKASTVRAPFETPPFLTSEHKVELGLEERGEAAKTAISSVSRCPIIEQESAVWFGDDLGRGTNLVGSGQFRLSDFRSGREVQLKRMSVDALHRESSPTVAVRAISDARQGLSALRVGTLDAFFTNEAGVVEKAKGDQTLSVSSCGEYHLIIRRGFTLSCGEPFELSDLRYVF